MKKFLIFITVLMLLVPCTKAYSGPNDTELTPLEKFIESYSGVKGVSAMNMKGLMLGIAKKSLKGTPADGLMKEIESIGMLMIEDDCPEKELEKISKEADEILKGYTLLGEITDDGSTIAMYVYGMNEDGFKEMVMVFKHPDNVIMTLKGNFTNEVLESMVAEE